MKDSKLLSPRQREELCDGIKSIIKKFHMISIPPAEIDAAVDGKDGLNLNWLEAHKTAEILNVLQPDKAFIDCPSPNIPKYTEYLRKLLVKKDIELVVEHKSDFLHVETGAASILAKCRRDEEIVQLQKQFVDDLGSGYPADPMTQVFIKKHWKKHPDIFRHSWAPYKALVDAAQQKGLDKF